MFLRAISCIACHHLQNDQTVCRMLGPHEVSISCGLNTLSHFSPLLRSWWNRLSSMACMVLLLVYLHGLICALLFCRVAAAKAWGHTGSLHAGIWSIVVCTGKSLLRVHRQHFLYRYPYYTLFYCAYMEAKRSSYASYTFYPYNNTVTMAPDLATINWVKQLLDLSQKWIREHRPFVPVVRINWP